LRNNFLERNTELIMENQKEKEIKFISEGSAKIFEEGNVFYNPVQEVIK
jgi:hypothetical protein